MSYIFGKFGMSNLGNTSGTSGTVSRGIVFAGGNNITLSQSVNASSATLSISAANQTVQTQNVHNLTIGSNTVGVGAAISSGTLTLAGGSNITLSQNGGNAITIHGNAGGGGSINFSAGTTSNNLAAVTFSNSNGVGFGLNGSVITASHNGITSQTNQTIGVYGVGNTTQSSSGVVDARSLSFNGLGGVSVGYSNGSVQISGATGGGGGGGVAIANSQTTYTNGTANLAVVGGALTIASTTGQSFNFSVPQTSSLAATGIVSISTNGSTISIGADPSMTGYYFDNMVPQNSVQGITATSVGAAMVGRLLLQPLSPANELFPYRMTASTLRLGFSNTSTATSIMSAAHSSSWYVGLYTRVNSTQLSLLNSVSTSYGMSANTGNSASYVGARWLSFHSSQFSAAPVLEQGVRYFFGVMVRTAGATYAPISMGGMHLGHSVARSGYMAAAGASNSSLNAWHPFMGVHATTNFTALPVTIANSEINKATSYANFIPQVIFDAGLGQM